MFLTTSHIGNFCFERRMFTTDSEAERYARDAIKERVHRIDHMVYMGKATINIWDVSHMVPSNHVDTPIATHRD
jgi:hypothetical protein